MKSEIAAAYDDYFRRFDAGKYADYLAELEQKVGSGYHISQVPLFLEHQLVHRLWDITGALLRFLSSAAYEKESRTLPWSLPYFPPVQRDLFGCADYYLTDQGPKLVEINMGPPGRVALVEFMEQRFCRHFGYDASVSSSRGFNERLVRAMSEDFNRRRIAITVSHLPSSSAHLLGYRYLEEVMAAFDIYGKMIYANDLRWGGKGFIYQNDTFDSACNLVIPYVWEKDPAAFAAFHDLFRRHPGCFFPNPSGARLATKALLAACMAVRDPVYEQARDDVENIESALLQAGRVSDYASADELLDAFGGEERLVLKPLKDYGGNGILIKPSRDTVVKIMDARPEDYIAQAYCRPHKRPFLTAEREKTERMALVRLFFVDGEYSGMRGYLQKTHGEEFHMAPVLYASPPTKTHLSPR